jgi:hypothetical protein
MNVLERHHITSLDADESRIAHRLLEIDVHRQAPTSFGVGCHKLPC